MAFQDAKDKSKSFAKPGAKPGLKPSPAAPKPKQSFKPREAPPLAAEPHFDRPRRAPKAVEAEPPAPLPADDSDAPGLHEFPAFYEPAAAHAALAPRDSNPEPAPHALDPRLERLIEISGAHLGCPHEEILHLKAQALLAPADVEAFCQNIFDDRIKPLREKADPLMPEDDGSGVAFWLEGHAGKAIIRAAAHPALAPYHGQRLDLYDPARTPFANAPTPPSQQD